MSINAVRKQVTRIALPHRDLLGIEHLDAGNIADILDLADYYVAQNRRRSQSNALLKGFVLVNLFLGHSTRTRLSFEMAAKRLGCDVINMDADGSALKRGEGVADTLKAIGAMLPDLLVLRPGPGGTAAEAAEIMDCPVVNGGGETGEHPTQALLDALTMRRHFGRLEGLKIALCGAGDSGIARSNILLLEKMGATVALGAEDALRDADAVMALPGAGFRLDAEMMRLAKPQAVILHPGPVTRDVEIDAALVGDPARSLITAQVEMGVAVRMACLDLLTRDSRR